VQPADSPTVIDALNERIRNKIDEKFRVAKSRKGNIEIELPPVPFYTELLKGVSKKQNLGVPLPSAPYILAALPPFSSKEASECLLLSNDFSQWLDKKVKRSINTEIIELMEIRKTIDQKTNTSTRDKELQSKKLKKIVLEIRKGLAHVQALKVSNALLLEEFSEGTENWEIISNEIVDWLNLKIAGETALFAISDEEASLWKDEVLSFLAE
jgi:hypothetical protein